MDEKLIKSYNNSYGTRLSDDDSIFAFATDEEATEWDRTYNQPNKDEESE